MPGARRTRSLACKTKRHTSVVATGPPVSPSIPCAMVLTAYFVFSPVTGLSCHRRLRSCLHRLGTSVGVSGPHDFAVRGNITRRGSPSRALTLPRPSHPAPNVRDDREAPLLRGGTASMWDVSEVCRKPLARDRLTRRAVCAWRICAICPSGQISWKEGMIKSTSSVPSRLLEG
jgi:hypothetical protein